MDDDPAMSAQQSANFYDEFYGDLSHLPIPREMLDEQIARNRSHDRQTNPYTRWNNDSVVGSEEHNEHHEAPEDCWMPEPPLVPPPAPTCGPWAFLDDVPKGTGILTYHDADGELLSVHQLNLELIGMRAPIIAASFEESERHSTLHLDLLSPLAALPFVRYLYTGTYGDGEAYNDVPTSLLLHSQLYFFASVFDIPDLKSQALINVLRQCEFACSSPEKPIDLCAALRFCYDHVEDNRKVIDETIEYCIERFANHKLGEDLEFRALAFDHRPFYSDLAKACRRRGFQDESAIDIIRLPYNAQLPAGYSSMEDISDNPRFQDVVQRWHSTQPIEEQGHSGEGADMALEQKKTSMRQPLQTPNTSSSLTLALRALPAHAVASRNEQESSSEDEGFQLVRPAAGTDSSQSMTAAGAEFVLVHRPKVHDDDGAGQLSDLDLIFPDSYAASRREEPTDDAAASSDSDWTFA